MRGCGRDSFFSEFLSWYEVISFLDTNGSRSMFWTFIITEVATRLWWLRFRQPSASCSLYRSLLTANEQIGFIQWHCCTKNSPGEDRLALFPSPPTPQRLVVVILTNEIEWSVNPGIARNASGKVFVRHSLWAIFSLSQHRCANHSWFTSDLIRLILLTSSLVLLQCLSWQTFQLPAMDERTVSWRQVLSEFLLPVMKFK